MKGLSQEMSFITKSDRNLPPPADRAFEDIEMCLQFVVSFSLAELCCGARSVLLDHSSPFQLNDVRQKPKQPGKLPPTQLQL